MFKVVPEAYPDNIKSLGEVVSDHIYKTLLRHRGSKERAATALKISVDSLRRKLEEHGIVVSGKRIVMHEVVRKRKGK